MEMGCGSDHAYGTRAGMLCSRAIYGLCFYPFYKNTAVEISTPYPPQYTSRKQLKFVNDNKRTN
jgi:hypothetical protein